MLLLELAIFTLVAQVAPTPDPWVQLGVAGAIVGFSVWIISFLLGQLRESRASEKATNERVLEVAERTLPAIAENTRVMAEVLDELRRTRER